MTGLSALNLPQPLVWILAFAIIFGLLAAFAHLLKRIAGDRSAELEGGRNRVPRLGLVDSFDLDRHRKLIIVRRDNVEHLLLVGPSDVVVESNIVRAAGLAPREERMPPIAPVPSQSPIVQTPVVQPPGQTPAMPIPPAPATPQAMQDAAPPVSPAPVMPTAPFPVPPPVRPTQPSKGTMPPPPPFGAPKRPAQQNQRVEPSLAPLTTPTPVTGPAPATGLGSIIGVGTVTGLGPVTGPAPVVAAPPLPNKPSVAAEDDASKPAAEQAAKPAEEPAQAATPVALTPQSDAKAQPASVRPVLNEPAEPAKAPDAPRKLTAALPADLSSKLEEVLKVKIAADDGIAREPARLPGGLSTVPDLPPIAAAAPPQPARVEPLLHPQTPPPAGIAAEIPHAPEPERPAPAPVTTADAFEVELRRFLGRAPQKG